MLRKNQDSMTPGRLADRAGRGFTLMEMVVGVGAVALVAVGLAAIFDSVGKTVSGGRRVSVVNTYAGLIESQLRRDFENMNRDGFLIIRNQWVDRNNNGTFEAYGAGGDQVPAFEDQPVDRQRGHRIDEIQFVASGKFRSSRQPLRPDVQAESNTAVIYIGHGLMAPMTGQLAAGGYKKDQPFVEDVNNRQRLGLPSTTAQPNPNEYPVNWMLLRHVTLLANQDAAQSAPVPPGTSVYGFTGYHQLRNRPTQFMLQPALSSLFRSVAAGLYPIAGGPPESPAPDHTLRQASLGDGNYPNRASGIVDIASMSLADIRAVVNTCQAQADVITAWPPIQGFSRTMTPAGGPSLATRPPVANQTDVDRMHSLLSDLMPTESRNAQTMAIHGDFPASPAGNTAIGTRIRYEEGPTDLLAAMATPTGTPSQLEQGAQAQRRADQLMLSSSNFVPHCTDFHVEWSFGMMDEYGQIIWHGLPTPRTFYEIVPGQPIPSEEPMPYPWASGATSDNRAHPYVLEVGVGTATHPVSPRLIYGFTPPQATCLDSELTSYFGWIDPTYAPTNVPVDALSTGVVPWAWPKLVRVTVTLVDPIDPSLESTFQYIFDVPEKQGQRAQ